MPESQIANDFLTNNPEVMARLQKINYNTKINPEWVILWQVHFY